MYQRILVPVDGSQTSNAGLAEAIKLARLTGAQVRVLHVVDEMAFIMGANSYAAMSGDFFTLLKESGQVVLEQARLAVDAADIPVVATLIDSFRGRLSDHVAEQVQEWDADVIVLGTHGRRGVGRMLLGSDAEQIVRTATVPVLLVRGTPIDAEHPATISSTRAKMDTT